MWERSREAGAWFGTGRVRDEAIFVFLVLLIAKRESVVSVLDLGEEDKRLSDQRGYGKKMAIDWHCVCVDNCRPQPFTVSIRLTISFVFVAYIGPHTYLNGQTHN